jgi:23S rRNA (uracil1939-C5)-methyltransferase
MRYETQVETKRTLVDREMARVGIDVRVSEAHAMRDPWRYRHTAALAIGWEAGFRPRARRGILEIHDCLISHPLIGRLADRLNGLLRDGRLPNYHGKVWLDCTVVGTPEHPRLQVVIQGIEGLTLEAHPELPDVACEVASVEGVGTVAFRHRSGTVQALLGDAVDTIEVAGREMYLPAGSFFQTNLEMVPLVLERMQVYLQGTTIRHAADIYGGVGTFGLPLASSVSQLTLVELDGAAVEAARRTAAAWELDNVEFVSRHAEHALPEMPALDLAIVDPPRSGLGDVVVTSLIQNGVPAVFYVSCSPQSLARDLAALLAGGYRTQSLEIFDFYPQTYHVESLAILERC